LVDRIRLQNYWKLIRVRSATHIFPTKPESFFQVDLIPESTFEVIMQQPAIDVSNLRKCFRKRNGFRKSTEVWALDGVTFSRWRRGNLWLLGPNGSGKSSLIRILSTVLIADVGEVRMRGSNFRHNRNKCANYRASKRRCRLLQKVIGARKLLYTALLYWSEGA
jgi:ABC-2 type transport system ATP-binding protein